MDGGGTRRETVRTRLYWQLLDQKPARLEYYENLFADMRRITNGLPGRTNDHKEVLDGLSGKEHLSVEVRIVRRQMKRFPGR